MNYLVSLLVADRIITVGIQINMARLAECHSEPRTTLHHKQNMCGSISIGFSQPDGLLFVYR